MRSKASCTQVRGPPFLNLFPFAEDTTTGRVGLGTRTVGARVRSGPAPRATPAFTNSRRLSPGMVGWASPPVPPPGQPPPARGKAGLPRPPNPPPPLENPLPAPP